MSLNSRSTSFFFSFLIFFGGAQKFQLGSFVTQVPTHLLFGSSDFFVLDRMAQNLDEDTMEKVVMIMLTTVRC